MAENKKPQVEKVVVMTLGDYESLVEYITLQQNLLKAQGRAMAALKRGVIKDIVIDEQASDKGDPEGTEGSGVGTGDGMEVQE